ncbi:MAG TPA: hypothetical protein VFE47_30730 [Tepidisphaeraceae bacterium]|nr:hypothetical protein [Tepidisphaeraceae bacterium]
MGALAYMTQDQQKVGAKVEEHLRGELEATAPLPFEVEAGDAGKTTVGVIAKEGLSLLFGGRGESRLFSLIFNLQQPRLFRAEFHMNRQGIGCHCGSILYSTKLSKPIKGSISLEDPKMFGSSKFVDADGADAAAKLNASKEILKAANNFARVKANIGGVDITAPRFFKIADQDGSAVLVAATLPRSYAMGFKMSTDAKEFVHLAELIEAAL